MSGLEPLGRAMLILAAALAITGLVLILGSRIPFLGRLPGDIVIHRDDVTIYLPLTTMLLVSLVLSLIAGFIGRGR